MSYNSVSDYLLSSRSKTTWLMMSWVFMKRWTSSKTFCLTREAYMQLWPSTGKMMWPSNLFHCTSCQRFDGLWKRDSLWSYANGSEATANNSGTGCWFASLQLHNLLKWTASSALKTSEYLWMWGLRGTMGSCPGGGRWPQKSGKARIPNPGIDLVLVAALRYVLGSWWGMQAPCLSNNRSIMVRWWDSSASGSSSDWSGWDSPLQAKLISSQRRRTMNLNSLHAGEVLSCTRSICVWT